MDANFSLVILKHNFRKLNINKLNFNNILDFIIFPYSSTKFHTFPGLENALLKFPTFSRLPYPVFN